MIVDTSSLIAICLEEEASLTCIGAMESATGVAISAATYLEAGIVIDSRLIEDAAKALDELLDRYGILIMPVTEAQARRAREAYRQFGKGRGHPAQLNFGDCFAYALATERNEPLLFTGNDFAQTDVIPAVSW